MINRTATRADAAAALCPVARVGTFADLAGAEIVINATSVGFDSDELLFDPALLHAGQVVADLVYHPLRTALLDAASERGCRTVDGLGMLVHQAALQQQLWTGIRPDTSVMREAVLSRVRAAG